MSRDHIDDESAEEEPDDFDSYEPPLDEHGLFVHYGAQRAIDAFRRHRVVGSYPLYLVGLAMPEHRDGPALVALLTLPDGGVLDAHARSLPKKRRVNGVLPSDVNYLDEQGLRGYQETFYGEFGGFHSAGVLRSSPTAIAEEMLADAWLGLKFGRQVGPSPQGPPSGFPSDWTDVAYYSQNAVGCTVEGFAPSADAIAALEVPETLKRAMSLRESTELDWLEGWHERVISEIHERVPALVAESWVVRFMSPQASVGLLRSAAELIAAAQGARRGHTLNKTLANLEATWEAAPQDKTPMGRRESARRASVLSAFIPFVTWETAYTPIPLCRLGM
jgi:hypothetical protein